MSNVQQMPVRAGQIKVRPTGPSWELLHPRTVGLLSGASAPANMGATTVDWIPPGSIVDQDDIAALRADLKQLTDGYGRPAAPEEISVLTGKLAQSQLLPNGMTADQADAWAEAYQEELEGVPMDLIERCCREVRRSQKFLPHISEFLQMLEPMVQERGVMLHRLNLLLEVVELPFDERQGPVLDWVIELGRRITRRRETQ